MKKQKLKIKSSWKKQAGDITLLTFIILLVYHSMSMVYTIHNLDTIHNFNYLISQINSAGLTKDNQTVYINPDSITDTGSDFVERPLKDYYISSNNNLEKYFMYVIFDALVIGLILGGKL